MIASAYKSAFSVCFALLLGGCVSYEEMAAKRSAKLLEIYPLQTTTREEVAARWAPIKPELAYSKPQEGWAVLEPRFAGEHVAAIEKRLNRQVASFERYYGPDGLLGLCRCWFYFDEVGRLVDAEWQYASD